jgi:adenylate cyclase
LPAPGTPIDIGAEHGSPKVEARFIVGDLSIVAGVAGVRIRTGYLSTYPRCSVTVHREGERGSIAIEVVAMDGSRRAWAYAVPAADVDALLDLRLAPVVDRTRHRIADGPTTWLVDVYRGANDGLVVASAERGEPGDAIQIPDWAIAEITDDSRFTDPQLARVPFGRLRRGGTWLVRASEFGQNSDLVVHAATYAEAVEAARLRLGPDAIVLGAAPAVATRAAGRARAKRLRSARTPPPGEPAPR